MWQIWHSKLGLEPNTWDLVEKNFKSKKDLQDFIFIVLSIIAITITMHFCFL